MARLFRRSAAVAIAVPSGTKLNQFQADVVEITDLRFRFTVKKSLSKEPNTAEIVVTNLSERSRAELQDKSLRISVRAGYEDTVSTIFVGDARDVDSAQNGPDWETTIQCGDGERGYRHGRTNESFRAGTKVSDVVKKFAANMGVDVKFAEGFIGELRGKQFVNGYAARGRAARELDRVLKAYGYEWSVQDNQLQILKPGDGTTETVVELTTESGLVGSPTLGSPQKKGKKPVLKCKSLLQPSIRPGRRIVIDSTTGIRGTFKVNQVTHTGDTAGGEWYTEVEAEPI